MNNEIIEGKRLESKLYQIYRKENELLRNICALRNVNNISLEKIMRLRHGNIMHIRQTFGESDSWFYEF